MGSYLELLRVFLTPTAMADSYAGFVVAASFAQSPPLFPVERLAAALGASVCVYWLGMAANDIFDRKQDARTAPTRPITSGRISVRAAAGLCAVLGTAAMALGGILGVEWITAALIGLAVLYDAGGKRVPIAGNLLMGVCRSGNFLLGAAAAMGSREALSEPRLIQGAVVLGLFIAGVTSVSRLEDAASDFRKLRLRAAPIFLVPAALYLARPMEIAAAINGVGLVLLLLDALSSARNAAAEPRSRIHGAALFVRKALPGLFLVDAGVVIALLPKNTAPLAAVLPLYVLFTVAWVWKRRWISAGSQGS